MIDLAPFFLHFSFLEVKLYRVNYFNFLKGTYVQKISP